MTKRILFLIFILSFIIRIIYINKNPLLWDEASIGYNAYSILKTGKDEYNKFLPYIFKSFGDYKPGFYIYLSLPFVAIFGLNILSVRLPSIIFGSLIPIITYLLINKLSPKSFKIALVAAFLISLNPWNIHFSRGAWESNILLFESLLGLYFLFQRRYFYSGLIFALTLYTYQGGKIVSPLLVITYLITIYKTNYRQFKNDLNNFILQFFLPLLIFSIPVLIGLFTKEDGNRLKVFSLWSYHRPNQEAFQIIRESNKFNFDVFHNEFIFFCRNFLVRYFNHFSPRFLAFEGDWQISRHGAPYIGVLLFPTYFLFLIGFFYSLKRIKKPINLFFILLLIIGPIPSALTKDIIQPVRSLTLSVPLIYFASTAIILILNTIKKIKSIFLYFFLVFSYLFSLIYFFDLYFNHMVKVKPSDWLYGYQESMLYAINKGKNKQVTFTDFYGQPYIYYLFFSKFDPNIYQNQSNLIVNGPDVGKIEKINNFTFSTPNFQNLRHIPGQLMIFSYDDVIRQGIDFKNLNALSPINNISTFYSYETP